MKKIGTKILAISLRTPTRDLGAAKGIGDQGLRSMHNMTERNDMKKSIIIPIKATTK